MNPYDFVRIDRQQPLHKKQPSDHARFIGITGKLEGTITTLTPLFIPRSTRDTPKRFQTNAAGQHIIPGSSLKGLIRTLVETIGPGCERLLDEKANRSSSEKHSPCSQPDSLCIACRMFGLIFRETLLEGHVRFDDAVCNNPVPYGEMYTPILGSPKQRHSVWYFAGPGGAATGYKYYFHSRTVRTLSTIKETADKKVKLNQHIAPIGINSVFTFSANFDNLCEDEWQILLFALVLEPAMRHKIGYAKPAGLGSIEVALTRIETIDMQRRYISPDGGKTVHEGGMLQAYIRTQTQRFTADHTSVTLNDLRRIWQWPPPINVEYDYPTQEWFNKNPTAPISATHDAPKQ